MNDIIQWLEQMKVRHWGENADLDKLLEMALSTQRNLNVTNESWKLLHDRVLELESALNFYADRSNHGGYYNPHLEKYFLDNIDEDGGYIARKVLGLEIDKQFRVYNSETNKTLWKSDNKYSCVQYLEANYTGDEDDWDNIWIEEVKESVENGR